MKINLFFFRCIIAATLVIFGVSVWQTGIAVHESISLWNSKFSLLWAIPFGIALIFLLFSWARPFGRFAALTLEKMEQPARFWRIVSLAAFLLSLPLFTLIILYSKDDSLWSHSPIGFYINIFAPTLEMISVRLFLFWIFVLLGTVCAKIVWRKLSWQWALISVLLVQSFIYSVSILFSQINNFPFALGWSDASRIYDASLYFATKLYGRSLALPVLHPTWHLLLTVPFLMGNLPVWVHRFWQAFLEFGLILATGVVFSRRLFAKTSLAFWSTVLWVFLFIRQISVLFSLLVCVIIIVGLMKPQKYWTSLLSVVLASIWAGLSRINWFPVPALLATGLYLLEIPYADSPSWTRYLWKPLSWLCVGTSVAFGTNSLYNYWSGNDVQGGQFVSSLTSDLLWNRLLPSAVFPLGVLLAAILAALPLILILFLVLRRNWTNFHTLRLAGLFLSLIVLFVGGLVVSIKIGGGGDLHNLDAFFLMLLLVSACLYFGHWTPETAGPPSPPKNAYSLVFAILVPIWFVLQVGGPLFKWDRTDTADALNMVKSQSQQVARDGGEVLFIYQRQLLALKMIDVPLAPDYEQDYLMEMVMSHNRPYLDHFHADLETQKYSLIIANRYDDKLQANRAWSEENNLWVQQVVLPLECYYEVSNFRDLAAQNIALYTRRVNPCR